MARFPRQKLPKQSNKVVGRTAKHKASDKSLARRAAKADKAEEKEANMVDGADAAPIRTEEEKAEDKAARKKLNLKNNQWKKQILHMTSRHGPRAV